MDEMEEATGDSIIDEILKLSQLRERGALTEDEFQAEKLLLLQRTRPRKRSRRRIWYAMAGVVVLIGASASLSAIQLTRPGGLFSSAAVSSPPVVPSFTSRIAYVADNADGGILLPINMRSHTAGNAIDLGLVATYGMAETTDGRTAYVIGQKAQSFAWHVVKIDLVKGKVVADVSVVAIPDWATVNGFAMSRDGRSAYLLAAEQANEIIRLDLSTGKASRPIRLQGLSFEGITLTPDGRTAWLGNKTGVTPVDLQTGRQGKPVVLGVGGEPALAFAPNSMTAFASWSTLGAAKLIRINLKSNAKDHSINLPGELDSGLVMTRNGRIAYVIAGLGNIGGPPLEIVQIDLDTMTVGSPISLPSDVSFASAISLTPDGLTAYVTGLAAVVPVDLRSRSVGIPVEVPSGRQVGPGTIIFAP